MISKYKKRFQGNNLNSILKNNNIILVFKYNNITNQDFFNLKHILTKISLKIYVPKQKIFKKQFKPKKYQNLLKILNGPVFIIYGNEINSAIQNKIKETFPLIFLGGLYFNTFITNINISNILQIYKKDILKEKQIKFLKFFLLYNLILVKNLTYCENKTK